MFNINTIKHCTAVELRRLFHEYSEHLLTLESITQPVKQLDALLVYMNSSKLDDQTKWEWEISRLNEELSTINDIKLTAPTVHKPSKIVALKGKIVVGKATTAEQGTVVGTWALLELLELVPPFIIFLRVHFKDNMLHGAPPGSKGVGTSIGWMSSTLFLPLLQHFKGHERPNKQKPKQIIFDNHESCLRIAALNFAKDNGIILLTLTTHCSHKLQPLDVSVFGPFKRDYHEACDKCMINHPGKPTTIYDVGGLIGEVFPRAFTPKNICSGFRASGIEPFDDKVFSEEGNYGYVVTYFRLCCIKISRNVSFERFIVNIIT